MDRLVSVVVLNYNGRHLLGECLEAVLRQTYQNQEVIVVDNGSTDGSQDFVREKFPSVRLLELPENLGASGGDNRGIEVARGEFIALLNNDAVPEPNWLEELCQAMEENPQIGTCAPRLMFYGTHVINEAGFSWTVWGHARDIGLGEPCQAQHLQKRDVFGACSAAALYRRTMLDEIGLFDEDYFMYAEEADLSFRAQLADYRCVYVPTAVVQHHCGATTGKNMSFRVFLSIRNDEFVFIEDMPTRLMLKYLPRHLFFFTMLNIACILRGRLVTTLRADWQILVKFPTLLKKRKQTQNKRKISIERLESLFEQETYWQLVRRQLNRWRRRKAARKQGGPGAWVPLEGPVWD